jgi:UDP-N-acetylmuramoyl-L-alanyl-D-glutamate--2,6-diaminopimelate ligase
MKITDVKELQYRLLAGTEETDYTELVYDTRKVSRGCLFVCQKGDRFDSHTCLDEIAAGGAAGAVVQDDCIEGITMPEGMNIISVHDTRNALALISNCYFGYPAHELITIAVTGTKGKTTTAGMIKHILDRAGMTCGYMGTIGIDYPGHHEDLLNTTPESFKIQKAFREMIDNGCRYAVMEVSSQAVKMHRIDGMQYDYGIFTNISNDHIGPGEHADFQEYLDCKTKIMSQCDTIFVNADDEHASYVIEHSGAKDVETFGQSEKADHRITDIKYVSDHDFIGIELTAVHAGEKLTADVGIPGGFNAMNAISAIAVCKKAGVSEDILATALKDFSINGRMETVYSDKDVKIIVDYAHNEVSTHALLETLRNYDHKRLVVVFGCGGNRSKERRYGMGKVAGEMSDLAILTEDNSRYEDIHDILADIRSAFDKTGGKCVEVPKRAEAVKYAVEHRQPGDIIAIIGKGHEDYIEVMGKRTHYTDQEAVYAALDELGIRH